MRVPIGSLLQFLHGICNISSIAALMIEASTVNIDKQLQFYVILAEVQQMRAGPFGIILLTLSQAHLLY